MLRNIASTLRCVRTEKTEAIAAQGVIHLYVSVCNTLQKYQKVPNHIHHTAMAPACFLKKSAISARVGISPGALGGGATTTGQTLTRAISAKTTDSHACDPGKSICTLVVPRISINVQLQYLGQGGPQPGPMSPGAHAGSRPEEKNLGNQR